MIKNVVIRNITLANVYNPFSDEYEKLNAHVEVHYGPYGFDSLNIESIITDKGVDLVDFLKDSEIEKIEQSLTEMK